jgi:hypothetical protein
VFLLQVAYFESKQHTLPIRTFNIREKPVPKPRRTRTYRTPTREEETRIFFIGYELTELFDEEEIEDFAAAARRRIIGEFFYATERNPRFKPGSDRRQRRRTDNYIWGLTSKTSDLARYVREHMHRPFIHPHQLPDDLTELSPKMVEAIIARAHQDVLAMVIQLMRKREIWYDEGVGIWQACQSSVDEFLEYKRAVKALVKVDHREFHGRVRSHSKLRGVPPGVSVSYA